MTYTPDARRFQQIALGGETGPVDCTAWTAAWQVNAHTEGQTYITGRNVRLHSDEPIPDKASPGLNLKQADDSVYEITGGRVNLDTHIQSQALTRSQVQARIIDGRWAGVQVMRGVLVDRGFLSGFRGSHALTVHARPIDNVPVIGDPLVPYYVRASWDAIFDAAEALTRPFAPGKVYAQFTRDLTPDYRVAIHPAPGYDRAAFFRYFLDTAGRITGRSSHHTGGFSATCSRPVWHGSAKAGVAGRSLVQATSGAYRDWFLDARYAEEVYP